MMEGYKEKFGLLRNKLDLVVLIVQLQEELSKFVTKGIAQQDQDYERANDFVKAQST